MSNDATWINEIGVTFRQCGDMDAENPGRLVEISDPSIDSDVFDIIFSNPKHWNSDCGWSGNCIYEVAKFQQVCTKTKPKKPGIKWIRVYKWCFNEGTGQFESKGFDCICIYLSNITTRKELIAVSKLDSY